MRKRYLNSQLGGKSEKMAPKTALNQYGFFEYGNGKGILFSRGCFGEESRHYLSPKVYRFFEVEARQRERQKDKHDFSQDRHEYSSETRKWVPVVGSS